MSWQQCFSSKVTSVAFSLTLSRQMILALQICRHYSRGKMDKGQDLNTDFSRFIPAVHAVMRRGLVEHHDKDPDYLKWIPDKRSEYDRTHRYYTVTEAGEHIYQLCVLAGLIQETQSKRKAA